MKSLVLFCMLVGSIAIGIILFWPWVIEHIVAPILRFLNMI